MMKNQKGVTLIALVITIIVLLILAGVSIAMLTGDNGILTQAKSAKISQIEGQVREEVNLAVQAAKMYSENKAVTTTTGWLAAENLGTVKTELEKDLTSTKGYAITTDDSAKKISITYTTPDYKSATNDNTANITVDVTLSGNTFTIGTFNYNYQK